MLACESESSSFLTIPFFSKPVPCLWRFPGYEDSQLTARSMDRKVPALAEIGPELSFETSNSSTMTGERATDFIWAIKLAKITKNGLQKDWTVESVTGRDGLLGKRATFSVDAGDQLFNPVPVLIHEGLDASEFDVSSVNFGKEEYYISLVDEKEEEEQPAQDGEEDPGLAASQCALAGQGGVPPEGFKEGGGMVLV